MTKIVFAIPASIFRPVRANALPTESWKTVVRPNSRAVTIGCQGVVVDAGTGLALVMVPGATVGCT
jgi:hypothetical protein